MKKTPINYHFIVAVWGEEYVDTFLNVCLPSLLTPGNLEAFENEPGAVFKIYTSPQDADRIARSEPFARIKRIMPARTILVDRLATPDNQAACQYEGSLISMRKCHMMATEEGLREQAAMVYLSPDAVWSEGALSRMGEITRSGKRALLLSGLRVTKEDFQAKFLDIFANGAGGAPAPPRELARLGLDHLHPLTEALFAGSEKFSMKMAFQVYWRANRRGFLARCLVMHPLMVRPRLANPSLRLSFDADYLLSACPDYEDYHIVTDSDEMVALEMSDRSKFSDTIKPIQFDPLSFADFVRRSPRLLRRLIFHKVRFHSEDLGQDWVKVEKESDEVIRHAMLAVGVNDRYGYDMRPRPVMDHVKRVAVFGEEPDFPIALKLAAECGWKVACFVDSAGGSTQRPIDGVPVKSQETLCDRNFDLIIVTAMRSKKAMFKRLEEMGFSYLIDYIHVMDTIRMEQFAIRLSRSYIYRAR